LSDRSVLSLRGANTYKLLQGLVTNDVRRLEERATSPSASSSAQTSAHTSAFYCGFLNPQGRLIGPAFLYNEGTFAATSDPAAPPSVLMDCHSANVPSLQTFIKRFMLRSKVKLADESEGWETWAIWSDDASSRDEEAMTSLEQEGKVLRDARTPRMGWRLLSPRNSTPPLPIAVQHRSPLAYTRHRIAQGVPDGPVELPENSSLPLEANLDLMGGVDYKKGCYVGQELTARTHHIGVVRKRVMPVRLH
ncbi:Aminomethyltransferase folate-binding domain-containing protein, partial [Jaminaea rosea]